MVFFYHTLESSNVKLEGHGSLIGGAHFHWVHTSVTTCILLFLKKFLTSFVCVSFCMQKTRWICVCQGNEF